MLYCTPRRTKSFGHHSACKFTFVSWLAVRYSWIWALEASLSWKLVDKHRSKNVEMTRDVKISNSLFDHDNVVGMITNAKLSMWTMGTTLNLSSSNWKDASNKEHNWAISHAGAKPIGSCARHAAVPSRRRNEKKFFIIPSRLNWSYIDFPSNATTRTDSWSVRHT